MPRKIWGRTFSFGELWTGGQGGWPCEHTEKGKQCGELSNTIQLSPKETTRLNTALPHTLIEGKAWGPDAASFILNEKLGMVVCEKHIKKV